MSIRLILCALRVVAAISVWEDKLDANQLTDLYRRETAAEQYYIEGEISYDEQNFADALPFHRAAARLLPDNTNYVMKVALDEYQLNQFEKAYIHFMQVLKANTSNTIASYYVKKLKAKHGYCFEEGCPVPWDEVTNMQPIVELIPGDVFVMNSDHNGPFLFPTFGVHSAQPFVIRNALQYMGADLSVFAADWLTQAYGTHPVDFYPQNMLTKPTKVYNVPLSKALDYLAFPEGAYLSVDATLPGTYIQWNVNESTWDELLDRTNLSKLPHQLTHSLDSLFPTHSQSEDVDVSVAGYVTAARERLTTVKHSFGQKTHWYMVLLGEAGSGMFAHQDTLAVGSWQAQVAGSKNWHVCSPTSPFIPDILEPTAPSIGTTEGQVCYETTLHTGDIIYYPPYYWHETKNLESPSISLSGTVVVDVDVREDVGEHVTVSTDFDGTYRDVLINSLHAECEEDVKGFNFESDFCDFIV